MVSAGSRPEYVGRIHEGGVELKKLISILYRAPIG
jgi:hypothetical protein